MRSTVRLLSSDGDDARIAARARLSFDREDDKNYKRLVSYLVEHRHDGPLEFCSMQVLVTAPLFVVKQLVRHRSLSFNEVSARYVELPREHASLVYRGAPETSVKQGSGSELTNSGQVRAALAQRTIEHDCQAAYDDMIANGVCSEQARTILPQTRMTRIAVSGTLRAWLHYLELRLDSHAQVEHRTVALQIGAYVKDLFPVTYAAWRNFRLDALMISARVQGALERIRDGASYEEATLPLNKREMETMKNLHSLALGKCYRSDHT